MKNVTLKPWDIRRQVVMLMPSLAAPINFRPQRLAPIWAAGNRLARCASGTASIEFVIVLNVLILFVFGIMGLGLIFYTFNTMENAAREATRRMSVAEAIYTDGPVSCNDPAALIAPVAADPNADPPVVGHVGSAEWYACTYLTADWLDYTVNAGPILDQFGNNSTCMVTGRITTSASDAFMMDFLGLFDGQTLVAEVSMRKEDECIAT